MDNELCDVDSVRVRVRKQLIRQSLQFVSVPNVEALRLQAHAQVWNLHVTSRLSHCNAHSIPRKL